MAGPSRDWKKGDLAVISQGWHEGGIALEVLGPAVYIQQWWVPVHKANEEDPTFYKDAGMSFIGESKGRGVVFIGKKNANS